MPAAQNKYTLSILLVYVCCVAIVVLVLSILTTFALISVYLF